MIYGCMMLQCKTELPGHVSLCGNFAALVRFCLVLLASVCLVAKI